MNPLRLKMKNFTVFQDEELHFTENGIYSIYGQEELTHKRNGIGKTSLVEAMRLALYGDTKYKDKDKPISFGEKEMEVEFDFEHNGSVYTVIRKRKRNKTSEAQILEDGVDTEIVGVNDVTTFIVNLVGVDYSVFQESFYFNKIDLKELTATKLINFLKAVLKLNRFDRYRDKAKEWLQKAELKLAKNMGVKETLSQLQSVSKNKNELIKTLDASKECMEKAEVEMERAEENYEKFRDAETKASESFRKIKRERDKTEESVQQIECAGTCPMCGTQLKDDKLLKELKKSLSELVPMMKEASCDMDKALILKQKAKQVYGNISTEIDKERRVIAEMESELKILNESEGLDQEAIEQEHKRLLELKSKVEQVVELFSPTNFPLFILNEYLPNLELIVNTLLGQVSDFSIEIITSKETKAGKTKRTCELALYKNGKEYDVNNLSGGEETIINMAFKIGIAKMFLNSTNFNMLVIDEGFGALGEINQKKITEMIVSLKDTFSKIFVISHVDAIRDYLENEHSITLQKSGNFTVTNCENVV